MDGPTAVASLNALSHASRLSAFRRLVQAGPGGLPVGELREQLDLPPATLSAHLNVLRSAGLVEDTREGRVIRVRAGYVCMNALIAYLTDNCCAGAAECGPTVACKPAAKPTSKPTSKRTRK